MRRPHIGRTVRRATLGGLVAAMALAGVASGAQARAVRGTVVHRNARAHSFALADVHGRLFSIHARRSPRPGSMVVVSVRRLRNGTFAAGRVRILGRRAHARVRVRGTVSYVDRRRGIFTLSARGVSMLVRTRRGRARMVDALPSVGTEVTATGTVDDQGELEDQSLQSDGSDTNGIDLEGTILAVNATARTLTVSADDDQQSGASVIVTVPAALDISKFAVGQEVELQVLPQPGGGYLLQGSASDEGVQGADDQADQQGNQGDDQGDRTESQQPGAQGQEGSDGNPSSATGTTGAQPPQGSDG